MTEGEQWTRDQLRALRARRFAPAAVGAFLLASQRRANLTRASRPELARQAWGWIALGAVPWLWVAATSRGARRRARAGLAWWLACGLMLDWHLGMFETVDGRPRRLGAADALTLTRAWLVPLAGSRPSVAACAIAGLTDALDGPLARHGEPTRAGRDLEGLADACFAAAALHSARRRDLIARWAVAAETTRLALGALYAARAYFLDIEAPAAAVTRAARPLSALRAGGLLLAAGGRRRAGSAVLGAVTAISAARQLGAA